MKIGVLGGSGLYEMQGLTGVKEEKIDTPFGDPSDVYVSGRRGQVEVCFLPRHGRGHRLMPSEINHRANIMGFKMLGADRVVSVSAVGSLKEHIRPRDIVLPDQYFDRTKGSLQHTFFGGGIVAHVPLAEPSCAELRQSIRLAVDRVLRRRSEGGTRVHVGGTYVNMEGPAFSTRAESHVYRQFGFDVIGMTSLPEAKLCREAELCYQAMAMVTDYDCWHETEESVSVEMIIAHLLANVDLAREIIAELPLVLPAASGCECSRSLQNAIITQSGVIPAEAKRRLAPILSKYV